MRNEKISIRRAPRDAQHPYMQLLRKVPQDLSLSLEERGLLIYILSLPVTWITEIEEMGKRNGIGRDKVRKIMNRLKDKGYCTVNIYKDDHHRFSYVEYIFSEEKLEVSSIEKPGPENQGLAHNECEPGPGFQALEISEPIQGTETSHTYTIDTKDIDIIPPIPPKGEEKRGRNPAVSKEVKDLTHQMIDVMLSVKPDYLIKHQATIPFALSVEDMIQKDNRKPDTILRVFSWAVSDSFWSDKMFRPNPAKYLQGKFDQLEMKMNTIPPKKERKFSPSSNDARALEYALEMERNAI